jgi:hypothetical protein
VCARARLKKPGSNSDSNNPESSLDDSGVVDDHEGGDVTSEETPAQLAAKHQVRFHYLIKFFRTINQILQSQKTKR